MKLERKKFWDLQVVNTDEKSWFLWLQMHLTRKKSPTQIIMTPNPEQLVQARGDEKFHVALRQADILLPDGNGLVWAAKLKGRLTGADTVVELLKLAKRNHQRVLLIGGRYRSDEKGMLKVKIPGLQTEIYYTQGYQMVAEMSNSETKDIEALIREIKPTVVLVALGAPWQEKWLMMEKEILANNKVKVAMAVGGSFDFLFERVKRAPVKWQRWQLEWLWRLLHEPWRWRRQLRLPRFIILTLANCWQ